MKPLGMLFTLVRYNLQLLPWNVWFLVVFFGFFQILTAHISWFVVGYEYTRLSSLMIIFSAVIGSAFFRTGGGYEGGIIPHGEFLLTRPIPRGAAYWSRTLILFILLLSLPWQSFTSLRRSLI